MEKWPEKFRERMEERCGYTATGVLSNASNHDSIKIGIPVNLTRTMNSILKEMVAAGEIKENELTAESFSFEVVAPNLRKFNDSDVPTGPVRAHFYGEKGWMRLHHDNHSSKNSANRARCALTFLNIMQRVVENMSNMLKSTSVKKKGGTTY